MNGEYTGNSEFSEFTNQEFYSSASNSTLQELAEFVFGNLKKAIPEFENKNQIKQIK